MTNLEFCIQTMSFEQPDLKPTLQILASVLDLGAFVIQKLTNFVLNMMDFALKTINVH